MKMKLILKLIKFLMFAVVLGIGIWYLDSAIGGASLTYTSTRNFLTAIGAADGDIAGVNGCFLCSYIQDLFQIMGNATEEFWTLLVSHLWILMAIGFGLFVVIFSVQHLLSAMKETGTLDNNEKKLELKKWFDKIWHQGARVLIVGAMIGALDMGGNTALRTITSVTITPVMFVGAELGSLATGAIEGASCNTPLADNTDKEDILNPVMQPFMCIMGNLNTVVLAGAAGGFSLMNYSWMGMGGGILTWVAGLGLVIMFLIIGFNLFFQVLSVIFKLIFLIIFMPILLAAAAFEPVWSKAKGLFNNAINMLVKSAVAILVITLKIVIMFAIVSFAADYYFPGPADGYSAILPPMLGHRPDNPDAQTKLVIKTFEDCESVSLINDKVDGDKFKDCFIAKKAEIESEYPGAFDFMEDGWDFILLMAGVFLLYFFVLENKINAIFNYDGKEQFDFGGWVKGFGKTVLWDAPNKLVSSVAKKITSK